MFAALISCVLKLLPTAVAQRLVIRELERATTLNWHKSWASQPMLDAPVHCMGLRFPNPVGISAGFDPQGQAISGLGAFGPGFIEVGSITSEQQLSLPNSKVVIDSSNESLTCQISLRSEGVAAVLAHLNSAQNFHLRGGLVGLNFTISPNIPLTDASNHFAQLFDALYGHGDWYVANFSGPGLALAEQLQTPTILSSIVTDLVNIRQRHINQGKSRQPLLIRISAHLQPIDLNAIATIVMAQGIDGIIVDGALTQGNITYTGGAIRSSTQEAVRLLRGKLDPSVVVIASGGITEAHHAVKLIEEGADLVMLNTGLYLKGPKLITETITALRENMH